jgi:predicted O-methyltransferase YrrM
MKNWYPKQLDLKVKLTNSDSINSSSAWGQIAYAIKYLIKEFDVKTSKAIEFGCEYGYSTSCMANYFDKVVAFDLFTGDKHAGLRENFKSTTESALSDFNNIELVQADCLNVELKKGEYDFAHVDIVHDYEPTFKAGSILLEADVKVVVFHDTLSFPEVYRAVNDLAKQYDCEIFNYPYSHGLGILIKK